MARSKGWNGLITANETEITKANSFEVSFSGDALENTTFKDSVYDRGFQPGLRSHTVSFTGYCDQTDSGQMVLLDMMKTTEEPVNVTIQCFHHRDEPGWGGNAVITGLTVSTPIDGLSTLSGTLQISGGLKPYLSGVIADGIHSGELVVATT